LNFMNFIINEIKFTKFIKPTSQKVK